MARRSNVNRKRVGKNSPKTKEFAQRFVDDYLNVSQELVRDLKPFKDLTQADYETLRDEEVRNVVRRNVKDGYNIDPFVEMTNWNTLYFSFFLHVIDIVLDLDGEVVSEGDFPSEDIAVQKKEPPKTITVTRKDGTTYKRSVPKKWTKQELVFINVRHRDNMKRKEIFESFMEVEGFNARTKSSINNMISRLKRGIKKINS